MDRKTLKLQTTNITLTTTQVHAAIKQRKNNNSIGPDKGNIKHIVRLGLAWTPTNNLTLNPTYTLFTPDPAEYSTQLELQIDNITLPMNINPKILGLTLDPKLTYNKHIKITATKARKTIHILKALTSSTWGKQKDTIITTYKAITRPILEYVSTIDTYITTPSHHTVIPYPHCCMNLLYSVHIYK